MNWVFGLAPSPWGTATGNDTWRATFGRLWACVKWTLFSRDDGEC
jgi:hypothetical protein